VEDFRVRAAVGKIAAIQCRTAVTQTFAAVASLAGLSVEPRSGRYSGWPPILRRQNSAQNQKGRDDSLHRASA
jgi:hypothetical protein